ncbi:Alpha/Beta hydrolase protein [Annulohypoxylon moriforme]|nr:Alpha/Beta hydrolase protein [Annulohypoxylon moriforme]
MATHGLIEVHSSAQAKVDIVFIHGLRGDVLKTWTKGEVLWPKDLLPKDIPDSRIFLFGYDTGIVHRDQPSVANTEIHSDANDLCAKLAAERSNTNTSDRPIVFVAHSLGGLVAAQILVHGEQKPESSTIKSITSNLRGMIFLGTPFRGSSSARLAEVARKIVKLFGINTQEHTLKLLGVDSERLDELTRSFAEHLNKRRVSRDPKDRIEAFFYYETLKTRMGVGLVQVVEADSAQLPGCGDSAPFPTDHIGICKFQSDKDEGYSIIVNAIRKAMIPLQADPQQGSKVINILGKNVNAVQENLIINGDQNITM